MGGLFVKAGFTRCENDMRHNSTESFYEIKNWWEKSISERFYKSDIFDWYQNERGWPSLFAQQHLLWMKNVSLDNLFYFYYGAFGKSTIDCH